MRTLLAGIVLLVLAGCGEGVTAGAGGRPAPPTLPDSVPAADGPVTTGEPVTVIGKGGKVEACLGPVLRSLPPECGGGTVLVEWDWAPLEGHFQRRAGVRSGAFVVTGTFDGEALTVTDVVPAREYDGPRRSSDDTDLTTPCPAPEGGWRVPDPARTTYETLDAATTEASRIDGLGLVWLDQSVPGEDRRDRPNDPRGLILNVSVTGDVARAESRLREVWGGMLCVSEARFSESELRAIQTRLHDVPGVLTTGSGRDGVDLLVVHDDGSIQAWADHDFGEGVVEVSSALVPAEG